jgi:hypothetical protein
VSLFFLCYSLAQNVVNTHEPPSIGNYFLFMMK